MSDAYLVGEDLESVNLEGIHRHVAQQSDSQKVDYQATEGKKNIASWAMECLTTTTPFVRPLFVHFQRHWSEEEACNRDMADTDLYLSHRNANSLPAGTLDVAASEKYVCPLFLVPNILAFDMHVVCP